MTGFASLKEPRAARVALLAGGIFAASVAATALTPAAIAEPQGKDAIPHFADPNFNLVVAFYRDDISIEILQRRSGPVDAG